jgi:hypothetical protein
MAEKNLIDLEVVQGALRKDVQQRLATIFSPACPATLQYVRIALKDLVAENSGNEVSDDEVLAWLRCKGWAEMVHELGFQDGSLPASFTDWLLVEVRFALFSNCFEAANM